MPNSIQEGHLQRILALMVVVFTKNSPIYGNTEYNYHHPLLALLIEKIGH